MEQLFVHATSKQSFVAVKDGKYPFHTSRFQTRKIFIDRLTTVTLGVRVVMRTAPPVAARSSGISISSYTARTSKSALSQVQHLVRCYIGNDLEDVEITSLFSFMHHSIAAMQNDNHALPTEGYQLQALFIDQLTTVTFGVRFVILTAPPVAVRPSGITSYM